MIRYLREAMSTAELKLMLIREIDQMSPEHLSALALLMKKMREEKEEKPQRQIGALKRTLVYMAPDFHEPLEDFKDYM